MPHQNVTELLRKQAEMVPTLGEVEAALRRGEARRRARRAVARSVAATMLVVGGAIGLPALLADVGQNLNPKPNPDHHVADPTVTTPREITIDPAVEQWLPETAEVGLPAPLGTAMAVRCQDGDCQTLLIRPDHVTQRLDVLSPELADLVESADASHVSLSYDGHWLAVPVERDIALFPLASVIGTTEPIVLRAQSPRRSWRVVAWGHGSLNVVLAERDGKKITRYALVDLLTSEITTMAPPDDAAGLVPVGTFGIGPLLSAPVRHGDRMTSVSTRVFTMEEDSGWPRGSVAGVEEQPVDVTSVLAGDETLAGPDGGLHVRTAPPRSEDEASWPLVTVYHDAGTEPEPSAVISLQNGSPTWRIDLPEQADVEWVLLGAVRSDAVLAARGDSEGSALFVIDSTGRRTRLQSLDGSVTWFAPGA